MPTDIRHLLEEGKKFFKTHAYKKAETVFLKILQAKNEFADVYNMLGVIYHQTSQFNKAIASFQKALKLNPNYTEAMLHLSVLYNDLGEYKSSKQLLNQSKKKAEIKGGNSIDPFLRAKLANKHADVGDLYHGVGLHPMAIEEYRKALALSPLFHDIRNKLGICLREEGQKKEAIKEFQKIVKEKSGYGDAHIQLGVTLYSSGQKKEARKIWTNFASANPKNQLVKTYLKLSEDRKK